MTDECRCKQALTTAFEEVALALGGAVSIYPIPDNAIWDLSQTLDAIHARACAKCGAQVLAKVDLAADYHHPAIVRLLAKLQGVAPEECRIPKQNPPFRSADRGRR